MLSMTDYIDAELIEESDIELITDKEIMESFMAMQVAFAQVECACEYQIIKEYCGTEIPHPTFYQEGEFKDAVVSFLENVWDWISGLVRSCIMSWNRADIARIISALENTNKTDLHFKATFYPAYLTVEVFLTILDELGKVLNDIKDGSFYSNENTKKEDIEFLKTFTDRKSFEMLSDSNATYAASKMLPPNLAQAIQKQASSEFQRIKNKDELVADLKKVYDLNIPVTGRKILKRIQFDKKDAKGQDKIDKETCRLIRKVANNIASYYEAYIWVYTDFLKEFCKDNEIKLDLSKAYKTTSDTYKSRTFRDQTKPVGTFTSTLRNNKS